MVSDPCDGVDGEQRSQAGRLHRHVGPLERLVQRRTQSVTARVQVLAHGRGEDLLEPGDAGGHGEHVVVERAGVRASGRRGWGRTGPSGPGARRRRRRTSHRRGTSRTSSGPGVTPRSSWAPPGASRDVMTSSKHEQRPVPRRLLPQHRHEGSRGGEAAAGAHHRLDEHGGDRLAVLGQQRGGALDVVVVAHDESYGALIGLPPPAKPSTLPW